MRSVTVRAQAYRPATDLTDLYRRQGTPAYALALGRLTSPDLAALAVCRAFVAAHRELRAGRPVHEGELLLLVLRESGAACPGPSTPGPNTPGPNTPGPAFPGPAATA